MAITGVGAAQANANTATSLALTRSAGTIGNIVIIGFSVGNSAAVPTISDTQSNTWLTATPRFADATNGAAMIAWYAIEKNTSSSVITVLSNVASAFLIMTLDEFTTCTVDQSFHSATGGSGTPISQSFTPTFNNELIWTFGADTVIAPPGNIDGSAATKGADDGFNDWSEYRILSGRAGVSMTAAFTGSGTFDTIGATFNESLIVGYSVEKKPFSFRPGAAGRR